LKLFLIFTNRKFNNWFSNERKIDSFVAINNGVHDRATIDKYHKDALFMLTEYTRNLKYRRVAELLTVLANLQEKILHIHLDKIFFPHLINRIPLKNLLHNIIRHSSWFIR
jgi:hypothetical protein